MPLSSSNAGASTISTNYVDLGPQNSRGFRALKVWMALRQVGRAGYRQMLADDITLARERFRDAADQAACEELFAAGFLIEHLVEPGRAVADFHRVLRPGGHLLVTVPNVAFWRFRLEALQGGVPSVTADERHLHSFNAALLATLVVREGFELVTVTGLRQRYELFSALGFTWSCDTLLLIGRRA